MPCHLVYFSIRLTIISSVFAFLFLLLFLFFSLIFSLSFTSLWLLLLCSFYMLLVFVPSLSPSLFLHMFTLPNSSGKTKSNIKYPKYCSCEIFVVICFASYPLILYLFYKIISYPCCYTIIIISSVYCHQFTV